MFSFGPLTFLGWWVAEGGVYKGEKNSLHFWMNWTIRSTFRIFSKILTKTCRTDDPPPPLCRIFYKKYTDNFWNLPLLCYPSNLFLVTVVAPGALGISVDGSRIKRLICRIVGKRKLKDSWLYPEYFNRAAVHSQLSFLPHHTSLVTRVSPILHFE